MTPSVRSLALSSLLTLAALVPAGLRAADAPPAVEPVKIADGIYTFGHTMANAAVLVGEEGVLLIDSGDKPEVANQLRAALATLTPKPVRLLVNTHWHFDHVNGNELFGAGGATLIGHSAMRARMVTGRTTAVSPGFPTVAFEHEALALPAITFDRELTLHFAGEEIVLVHPTAGQAHTDGDVVVYFKHANVVHLGDLYFQGLYPYIDVGSGGWIDGVAAACREVLARIDDQTGVIPGHGSVATKKQLEAYTSMLADIGAKITALIQAGRTLDEVKAAKPTAAYDEAWGKTWLTGDQFTELAYNSIVAHTKK